MRLNGGRWTRLGWETPPPRNCGDESDWKVVILSEVDFREGDKSEGEYDAGPLVGGDLKCNLDGDLESDRRISWIRAL